MRRALAILVLTGFTLLRWQRPSLYEGVSFSRLVEARDGQLLRLTRTSDDKQRLFVPLAELRGPIVDATLMHEDRHFRWHPGVDPTALVRALWSTAHGRQMGGSTLTMQLARIRYGLRTQTLGGKLRQMLRALQLEAFYSKDELLEAYLNLAPYGGNIEGVGAASLVYFRREPKALGVSEALALVALPQSPSERDPARGRERLANAHRRLGSEWNATHGTGEAGELPRFFGARGLPSTAPHHIEALLATSSGARLRSTLDAALQRLVERKVQSFVEAGAHLGIDNAAVLLLDASSVEVRAEVGSADYANATIAGQVNGTLAKRSPGSTLKPFLYALAIDQGLIHGDSLLIDAPARFSGFNPENFERDFQGPLAARLALVRSRNVPAVTLLQQLGLPAFHHLLETAGVTRLQPPEHYGLALALGGAELTLTEIAGLYAALANDGRWQPVKRATGETGPARRLFSGEAAWMVRDMLQATPVPGAVSEGVWRPVTAAWKTGTSHGFHDAWTFGVVGPYVLGVWVGHFDNRPDPALVGLRAAAPLFFSIVDGLRHHDARWPEPVPPPGLNLTRVEVCSVSGMLPSEHCPHKKRTWFIPGTSPIATCDLHRSVIVDKRTGEAQCSFDPLTSRTEVFEFWPSHVMRLFAAAGMPRKAPPVSTCGTETAGHAPDILSPQKDLAYVWRTKLQPIVPLLAAIDASADSVHWFDDTHYLGKAAPGESLEWRADPGRHVIRAVDSRGRSQTREIEVVVAD